MQARPARRGRCGKAMRPPPTPEQRAHARMTALMQPVIDWTNAVNTEAWRLVYADGGNRCGPEQYARGRRSLIEQGKVPPPECAEGPD